MAAGPARPSSPFVFLVEGARKRRSRSTMSKLVLGIESSSDETAAAVLADGRRLLASVVASQDDVHGPYGGVVPELASCRHFEVIVPVVDKALTDAGVRLGDLDG